MSKERQLLQNVKFTIAYEGTKYQGWQRLGGKEKEKTIQGILEDTLTKLVGRKVVLVGSGRTDAGVHAYGQVANGLIPKSTELTRLYESVNEQLPKDIQVVQIEPVTQEFHSRYDAVYKVYEYRMDIREVPSVFTRTRSLWVPKPLQVENMRKAASLLLGTHDFLGYASAMPDGRSTVKTINRIEIIENQNELCIEIQGDGFLYNMVRILVGTLLEVGIGAREIESVLIPLKTKNRQDAGPTLSSIGLYLKEVGYKTQ